MNKRGIIAAVKSPMKRCARNKPPEPLSLYFQQQAGGLHILSLAGMSMYTNTTTMRKHELQK